MSKFIIGTCIIMSGHAYKIENIYKNTYMLKQTLTVFEEDREFTQLWKIEYVDKIAEKIKMTKNQKCKDKK